MNNQEIVLTENDIIVSKTDLKGIITYVNDDLVRITGFSKVELIGASHNIFRHPDMPKEAFADLWETIKQNRTWSGWVKNKTKAGGFYWVYAKIAPIYENQMVSGYMSVRRKASLDNIQAAEKLYTDIKAGRFKGKLQCGEAVQMDIFHTAQRKFEDIKIKHKLLSLVLLSVFSILMLAGMGYSHLHSLNAHHQSSLDDVEQIIMRIQTAHATHSHPISSDRDSRVDAVYKQTEVALENELKAYIVQAKMIANEDLSAKQHIKGLVLAGGILSALILFCGKIIYNVLIPLSETNRVLGKITSGTYVGDINYRSDNEIGIIMERLRFLSITLGFEIAETQKMIRENFRLKYGLDNVNSSILIANQIHEVVYANKAAMQLFSHSETATRTIFSSLNVENLIGSRIDSFHPHPEQQRELLSHFNETITTNLLIGDFHLLVKSNPIIDEFGVRLGSVAEFEDLTDEINLQNSISTMLIEATQGRFKNHIVANNEGFLKLFSTELNKLLTICDTIFGELKHVLSSIVLGNLTQRITNDYKGEFDLLKQDTNIAVAQLNSIIDEIKSSYSIINDGIGNIIEANNDLSQRAEIQMTNLGDTVAAVHQLTKSAHQNNDDATQANVAVNKVFDVVNRGVKIVGKVVNTMDSIHESSEKIGDIIAVIDSIAFQTNILALNAAVEAARAGENGKGFAVVAVEVRNLAQRAASAADEIKALITDSEEKVEDGSKLVIEAGKIMQNIANSIGDVTGMMGRIAVSCTEQHIAIAQMNSNIMMTEKITQGNVQSTRDVMTSSQSLEEQIQALSKTIDCFKVEKQVLDFELF